MEKKIQRIQDKLKDDIYELGWCKLYERVMKAIEKLEALEDEALEDEELEN
jgi:hypothetical protein